MSTIQIIILSFSQLTHGANKIFVSITVFQIILDENLKDFNNFKIKRMINSHFSLFT